MESISIFSLLMKLFNLPTAKAINSLCRKEFHWVVPLAILCYSGLFGGRGKCILVVILFTNEDKLEAFDKQVLMSVVQLLESATYTHWPSTWVYTH
jgi:hypothetical protein